MAAHERDPERDGFDFPAFGTTETRAGGDRPDSLATQQVEEMVAGWRRGERPLAEEFLARHPELGDEAAIRLIYEEVCLRQELGLEVDRAEVVNRFPKWKAELELLLDCQRLLEPLQSPAVFPEVGEVLGGFRLLAELGHGVSGRVYLASQPSLADRPVVLKVTTCGRVEHLSLARLQHMNIVPLYSEQVLAARNLRILCMPYLGGAPLARILELLCQCPPQRRTGKHILDALDQSQAALPLLLPAQGPSRRLLTRATYVQAICWLGASLADGLQYAHEHGLVHMDVKPSNVLLTADGQPMLLDFHLARGPIGPGGPSPAWLGGTPHYVSPEQEAAMAALREGRAIVTTVDGRSDIYSLGVLLYEALGGSRPMPGAAPRLPLHRLNPDVSVGLSDLIHNCLRPDPRDRYPDASALATDLRRHLNHLPLLGVPNRSPLERWRKWRRRRPSALPRQLILLVSATVAFAAAALLSAAFRQRVHEIETALGDGKKALELHRYAEARDALRQGLALAVPTPGVVRLRRELVEELDVAMRDGKAAELHRLADLIRFRYGLAPKPSEEARSLIRRGRVIWEARDLLTRLIAGRRDPDLERTIRTDLLDFVTVWADLRVRLAPPSAVADARREALQSLNEAHSLFGASAALDRLRQSYAESIGTEVAGPPPAPELTPQSAWEHCDLGKFYLRSGGLARAADEFQRALELRPQDFWPNFYQGLCAYQLGRFEDASDAFRVCIALAPETAECYYNRGLAQEALGNHAAALHDYTRALELDRGLTDAALNRGILHYSAGRYAKAAADLDRALATANGPETLGIIHYNRALVSLAQGDRSAAMSNLEAAVKYGHEEAQNLSRRLE